jgi:hypothetical protein
MELDKKNILKNWIELTNTEEYNQKKNNCTK